jgi:dTDP-4-dehydrorhamnose reductase
MRLLVGGDSEIGAATHRYMREREGLVVATTRRADRVAADRPFLDLAAPLDDWEPPRDTTAACIFAAVARLAACAADPAGSARINVIQTLDLTERLLRRGIHVLFLSTNQVFDGSVPHVPADAPVSPVSEYGRQKARTEAALLRDMDAGAPLAILRLAKVVSADMPLIHGWIDTLAAGRPIRAFHDMTMAPVATPQVACAIDCILRERARGIFQLTGPRDLTYADVGRFVARRLAAQPELVHETSAIEAGLPPGATPRHTTLDSSLLRARFGIEVPDASTVLGSVVTSGREKVRN